MAMKILIVDDAKSNRSLLKLVLSETEAQFSEASDGLEALEILKEEYFDFVVTDLVMPNMDGHETLIKYQEWADKEGIEKRPYFIVQTGFSKYEKQDEIAHFDYCIRKPINKTEILGIINLNYAQKD